MIHVLSERYRREFSRSFDIVRFGMASQDRDFTPVLLIKAGTLTLKYLIRLRTFRLLFWKFLPARHLWYGVQIADDPAHQSVLWSVVESEEELAAIQQVARSKTFSAFLFNEHTVNVVSANVEVRFQPGAEFSFLVDVQVAPQGTWRQYEDVLDSLLAPATAAPLLEATPVIPCEWIEIPSTLITSELTPCELTTTTGEEGRQQEALVAWLLNSLGLPAAVRNPTVHEERRDRQLADLVASYEHGCFLIESKTLAVLDRLDLPSRSTLTKDVRGHITKAVRQLKGACTDIRRGLRVTDSKGQDVVLDLGQPVHCMVLVPDLSLLADCSELGCPLLLSFMSETKSFLHLLDLVELQRLVNNAGSIATKSRTLTPLMAFEGILIKRYEQAGTQRTPCFRFHLTIAPEHHIM
jgi:hypothetical protein